MEMKSFLSEFKGLSDVRREKAQRIKNHNLPVIIFGAARMAKFVTDELNKFDVKVDGYAVDSQYYKSNQTYLGKPVYNFDELSSHPDKYVFILGLGSKLDLGQRAAEFMNRGNYIHYSFVNECFERIDYNYISKHAENFVETYNLLEEDFSRGTMMAYLKSHVTRDSSCVDKFVVRDQYFNNLTSKANRGGVH